jgi:eukaryotic-like serine/threonine-protein kinase
VLEPNQIFAGRYRIVRHLADGGMGVIFEAEHLATEAHVALKLLWPHVMQVASARQRFELEAKVAARVNSEHIVRVLDAGFDPQTRAAYLVMELLLGSTLAASVKSHGAMSPALTVTLMRQVARGLDAAHGYRNAAGVLQPIVHRDLKPDNLFLCARPEGLPLLKILDFGIAKVLKETANVSQDVRGTPAYMAYEQVTGEALSPQTDIWALGLITFYALTGRAYWPSANQATAGMEALFAEILTLPLPRASDRIRDDGLDIKLPRAFDAWLLGCIARKPSQRFASAGEAIDALELVLRAPTSPEAVPAEAKRFTELAYATTAVLQGGPAWPIASHSVAGVASERSHLGGSPRQVALVSVVIFALTLVGLAWHFAQSDPNRPPLATSTDVESPALPGAGSAVAPLEPDVQPEPPAPSLVPPELPERADAGDASAARVERDAGLSEPRIAPYVEPPPEPPRPVASARTPVWREPVAASPARPRPPPSRVSPAPRAPDVEPQPEPPTPAPEPPLRAPAPEPPETPPVIPREPPVQPPVQPEPDPPQPPAPPPDEPLPDDPPPDEPPPDEPPAPPPDEPLPDDPPPDEPSPDEPPAPAPDDPAPDEPPADEPPPDEPPPDEPPPDEPAPDEPDEPADEPCTFDPYTGRCTAPPPG